MATVREGRKGALVVVDVQVGVVDSAWDSERVVGNVAQRSTAPARPESPWSGCSTRTKSWCPTRRRGSGCPSWSPPTARPGCPRSTTPRSRRPPSTTSSARLGVSHVALAGAATNWCIRATAYAALERGYDLTLLEDAHTTNSEAAETVVDDLNTVMRWVSYADVSNAAVPAAELDFTALA